MRTVISVLAAIIFATISSQAAPAETSTEAFRCPRCRAVIDFTTCKEPAEGSKAFVGTVVFHERAECSDVLSVRVQRPEQVGLPTMVRVDLGFCSYWAGKIGDIIDLAIFERPMPGNDVYLLACRR